ncbi:MAG: patatin-like phospholipase family protein [Myxococcota bacterium]
MATFDIVFEGGGAKGVALSGAVSALLEAGHGLGRLVGTSAGAITATNLAVGYTPAEILEGSTARAPSGAPIYTTFADHPSLSDAEIEHSGPFELLREVIPVGRRVELAVGRAVGHLPMMASLALLSEQGGLHRGDGFLTWMHDCLESRGVGLGGATLGSLHARTGRDLSVVATDTTDHRMLVLNHRTAPDVPVVWAVRMSMSIPFYWTEVRWDAAWGRYLDRDLTGHAIVDGGVVSNFPLFLLTDPGAAEVRALMGDADPVNEPLGLYLDADLEVPGAPAPAGPPHPLHSRIGALLDTLMSARDNATFDAHAGRVIRLPVRGYGTTEFDMSPARVSALYEGAASAARAWLDRRHS